MRGHRSGYGRVRLSRRCAADSTFLMCDIIAKRFFLFFAQSEKRPSSRGVKYFGAAALLKSSIYALELGGVTCRVGVPRGHRAEFRRVRSSGAAAPYWRDDASGVFREGHVSQHRRFPKNMTGARVNIFCPSFHHPCR
jgi:hypothetical protein